MYVEKLTIRNYRVFEDAEVTFNYPGQKRGTGHRLPDRYPNVTLLIGANGAGKTSVFSAMCLAVLAPIIRSSGLRAEFFVRRPPGYTGDRDIGNRTASLPNAEIRATLKLSDEDTSPVPRSKHPILGQAVIKRQSDFEDITTALNNPTIWQNIFDNSSPAFFLVAYGSNRRAANPEGYSERLRSPRYQRVASIFEEYFGLVPFTVGYLELEQSELLQEAQNLLNQLLPDGVELTPSRDAQKRPLFSVFGVLQPFSTLSDGFRGFISWVWDLLAQMARVLSANAASFPLSQMAGVVIVDEVDMFLHPDLQRFVIEELSETFPSLQFLFSSHSPLVVGSLQKENLRVIRDGMIEQYNEEVEGKTPNELLTSAYFGLTSTRSPRSGTLSEQMVRERPADADEAAERDTLPEINEQQRLQLRRLMQRTGQFTRALNEAERDVEQEEQEGHEERQNQ